MSVNKFVCEWGPAVPTTFNAISLGVLADMDTTEGNTLAENASALVGLTFGSAGDALVNDFVSLSEVGNVGTYYGSNNAPAEQFSINGGAAQTFDSTALFNATITYIDGTTAPFTAVIFQDVSGNTYLAPEFSANADQATLEAGAIQSISFDSLAGNNYSGMTTDREDWNFVTCFVSGTQIETANGPMPVEQLKVGDLLRTVDNGLQPIRWIGNRRVAAQGDFAPILINKGALGNDDALRVSPQHRILLSGWRAELHYGQPEVLAAAKTLLNGDTIVREAGGEVAYFHFMFDQHELIYSAGIETESFHPGQMAWPALSEAAREEILNLFPELRMNGIESYGAPVRPMIKAHETQVF